MTDKIYRFIFDTYGIRGEMVKLEQSSQTMLQAHQYPPFVASLLQQTAAVSALLTTTLKFEGRISIQLQTHGKIKRLIVQTTHDLGYRGLVHFDRQADYSEMTFKELTKNGQMSITIEPLKGKRYQGIVPLDGNNLAQCVEKYFDQSEQLKTRIWLYDSVSKANESQVFGLMLQALPDMLGEEPFNHLACLADTLTQQECLSTDSETLQHRLFHQESLNNLAVDQVRFECSCSRTKMLNSLSLLSENELNETFDDIGDIKVECEFCLSHFSFNQLDIKASLGVQGNLTQH